MARRAHSRVAPQAAARLPGHRVHRTGPARRDADGRGMAPGCIEITSQGRLAEFANVNNWAARIPSIPGTGLWLTYTRGRQDQGLPARRGQGAVRGQLPVRQAHVSRPAGGSDALVLVAVRSARRSATAPIRPPSSMPRSRTRQARALRSGWCSPMARTMAGGFRGCLGGAADRICR